MNVSGETKHKTKSGNNNKRNKHNQSFDNNPMNGVQRNAFKYKGKKKLHQQRYKCRHTYKIYLNIVNYI